MTYCLLLLQLFVAVLCLVLVWFSTLCPFSFCTHFDGDERAFCFALNVFPVFCDSQCSVALLTVP